jgi:hypothetical protein
MSRYKVTAIMFLDSNPKNEIHVEAFAIHPDLAKQSLYAKYPRRSMKGISIVDITPMKTPWSKL